jgi:hypothetical protein
MNRICKKLQFQGAHIVFCAEPLDANTFVSNKSAGQWELLFAI